MKLFYSDLEIITFVRFMLVIKNTLVFIYSAIITMFKYFIYFFIDFLDKLCNKDVFKMHYEYKTVWPSGPRRQTQVAKTYTKVCVFWSVYTGVGSNPTAVKFF